MSKESSSRMICDRYGNQAKAAALETETRSCFGRGSPSAGLATELSPARIEKIVRLRRLIANDSYRVSAADLAGKLIWHVHFPS